MKKKDFAELKGSLAEALAHVRGKVTLKTRDIPLPAPVAEIKPADIVRIRQRLNASQGVFARMLNVSRHTEISWETGRRKPSGAALRLLQIVEVEPDILPRVRGKS
ncbi:MAG TPA: XRE family transcriptional regulator [Verrucomicrobiae bacterium]|nr:XRE family transcriptional regulator [Verrucomicrobiae bacterium]